MTFKPIARGPQTGAPPSLEFVGVDRLQVDPAYQRAIDGPHSRKVIVGMLKEWDWKLCQPLVVTRRLDGSLFILDGQHRHAGALERGDIAHLPCVVLPAVPAEDEAKAFVDLNTRRQRLSQTDLFLGMLAAGDEHAKATAALLEDTGWRMVRTTNPENLKAGDLTCAPSVAGQLKMHGTHAVKEALLTLREAYPDEPVTAPARLIQALVQIYRRESRHKDHRARIERAMSPISAAAWLPKADRLRVSRPELSQVLAIAAIVLDVSGLQKLRQTPSVPQQLAPRPQLQSGLGGEIREELFKVGLADDAGAEPQAFCSQCERRKTRDQARACESRFCKLKSADARPGPAS